MKVRNKKSARGRGGDGGGAQGREEKEEYPGGSYDFIQKTFPSAGRSAALPMFPTPSDVTVL